MLYHDVDLGKYSSIKIGGSARNFYVTESFEELVDFLKHQDGPFYLLGGGSNLLIEGALLEKPVVKLGKEFDYIKNDGGLTEVGAATPLKRILNYCVKNNLEGLDNLAGIPATLGGLLAMNASAFGREVSFFLRKAQIADNHGNRETFDKEKINFDYRHSSLKGNIVLRAWFEFRQAGDARSRIKDFLMRRFAKQDFNFPSCGCIFKNPPGAGAAGFLIDSCGLKGLRKGGAKVSDKHANFIINAGGAGYGDVDYLIRTIKDEVFKRHNILLEEEIERWV